MLASDLAGEGDVIQVVSRAFDVLRCFEGHEARLGNLEISSRCGLPRSALPVFRAALSAVRETGFAPTAPASLSRRMVERALTACDGADVEVASLAVLLRRYSAEAAREEARRSFGEPAVKVAAAA